MGYALFIIVSFLFGWFGVPIMLVSLPLVFLLSLLRLPPKTYIAAVAFLSGCLWGVLMYANAFVAVRWLGASQHWITGIGIGIILFASPKVLNALFAVPAAILTFVAMSCWLL
jgi:hypothetical protein